MRIKGPVYSGPYCFLPSLSFCGFDLNSRHTSKTKLAIVAIAARANRIFSNMALLLSLEALPASDFAGTHKEYQKAKYRYANQDIDQTRTHLNYAIFARDDPAAFVQSKIDGVDVKPKGGDKATNVISDWVITLPKNSALIGREREFFQTAYGHMLKTVPEKQIVGAWVHMDENQPHMHFCFCPIVHTAVMTNDKSRPLLDAQGQVKRDKKGTPRYERVQVRDAAGKPVYRSSFGQTKVYTRARMKKFHPDLEKAMEGHFLSLIHI